MFAIRSIRWLLLVLAMLAIPAASFAQVSVGVSIRIGPPVLPVYAQPICPGPSYIWAPGYWAYGPDGYFWVPGTWVLVPAPGLLWTPGYWAWREGFYVWRPGYWGPHVGFYGGINYGFGYVGVGYLGGYWSNGVFNYNRTVNNINITNIHNTYNKTVINNTTVNRVSYNGGTGGTAAQPTAQEQAAAREQHTPATAVQTQHEHSASTNRAQLASVNHGRPSVAASAKPGEFSGNGVVAARGLAPSKATPRGEGAGAPKHPNTAAAAKNTGHAPLKPNNQAGPPRKGPPKKSPPKGEEHHPGPEKPQ